MPRLALKGDSPLGSFAGGHAETKVRWFKGEERDVSQATADYLLETFSDVFEEVVGSPVVASAVEKPAADKAIKSPAKKKAPAKKATATKKASAKKAKA
ncbi:MAG: hypothetical protein GOVbin1454_33 [Prokaryotic dsDNA virus sp.]|nr:MAG: hypothetical protein GOVbin1454_33 [Prokaryotic dsDNA virus sp.]|tara:strand:- start:119 stop:415 length:297 start_codon:yes stop_codon:yes gene_type:complete